MKRLNLNNYLTKYFLNAFTFTALFFSVSVMAQVTSENPLLSRRVPHPLYIFWTRDELVNDKYLRNLDKIRAESPFDEVIISFRPYDDSALGVTTDEVFQHVKRAAEYAAKLGIRLSIHLAHSGVETTFGKIASDERAQIAFEKFTTLDADGNAEFSSNANDIKGYLPATLAGKANLLRVFAYELENEDHFKSNSLVDITNQTTAVQTSRNSLKVSISGGKKLAGKKIYALISHEYIIPDMFSDHWQKHFDQTLAKYASIGIKGADLDEFSYIPTRPTVNADGASVWHERFYSPRMAKNYEAQTKRDLVKDLFLMRVAPFGDDAARITATNQYFEILRKRIVEVDKSFYDSVKKHLGADAFVSTHPTWRAGSSYEFWADYWYWWDAHRDFGQTDEGENPAISWNLARKGTQPFWIDMFYEKNAAAYSKAAINAARFGGRIDYHAVNDKLWGYDLGSNDFYAKIAPLEDKIKLLDYVQRALPDARILLIFGYPAYTNSAYPNQGRDSWGIPRSFLNQYGDLIWRRGYLADIVPSYEIDDGDLKIDENGRANYQGQTYDSVIFDQPQGSKISTLEFLEKLDTTKQKLTILGDCNLDFAGLDISKRFAQIKAKPLYPNDLYAILNNSPHNEIENGTRLSDGSVLMFDDPTRPYQVDVSIKNHSLKGQVSGAFLSHLAENGSLDRLGVSGATKILLDDKPVLIADSPLDVAAERIGTSWNILTQNTELRGAILTRIGETELPALRPIIEVKRDAKNSSVVVNVKLINESKTPSSAKNVKFFVEQFPSETINKISSTSAPNKRNLVAEQSFSFALPTSAATSNFRLVTRIDAAFGNHNLSFRTIVNVPNSKG
jgi:hypothetical protein